MANRRYLQPPNWRFQGFMRGKGRRRREAFSLQSNHEVPNPDQFSRETRIGSIDRDDRRPLAAEHRTSVAPF